MVAWDDPRVMPHVRDAAREIGSKFGIMNIGGYRDTNDPQDHGKGLAIDVMTANGEPVATFAQQNAARLGVTYVIWNRAIWDSRNGKGWVAYTGASPHTDHVHISFKGEGGDPNAISVSNASSNAGCARILSVLAGGKAT